MKKVTLNEGGLRKMVRDAIREMVSEGCFEKKHITGPYSKGYNDHGDVIDDNAYVDSYDYIVDSVINGNISQARELYARCRSKRGFCAWLKSEYPEYIEGVANVIPGVGRMFFMESRKFRNESRVRSIVRESLKRVLNEGAGAGYDVTIEGLKIGAFKLVGSENANNDVKVKFMGQLAPSEIEWKAEGYYEGVTSEGMYWGDEMVKDIPQEAKMVQGGTVEGYVWLSEVQDWLNGDEPEQGDVRRFIEDKMNGFGFTTMYGGGWSHTNLPSPMVFENVETAYDPNYGCENVLIDKIVIEAPGMVENVNWYFENASRFDEIFGGEEESEEEGEEM